MLFGRTDPRRILVRIDLEFIFIDGCAVAIFALDQHHPDCRGCHRHTKNGVHNSPNRPRRSPDPYHYTVPAPGMA